MFEFYKVITNPDTQCDEIVKCQCEEDADGLALKEKLEKEIGQYEEYEEIVIDRYYHSSSYEKTYPINLASAVFKDDHFVGCMHCNSFYLTPWTTLRLSESQQGATSTRGYLNIRKKR